MFNYFQGYKNKFISYLTSPSNETKMDFKKENIKEIDKDRNINGYEKKESHEHSIICKNEKNNENIDRILESKIGLYNAGGSCYMASIIQILIHLKLFLEQFYKSYNCNTNSLYIIFLNFIYKISTSNNVIDMRNFANRYNQININLLETKEIIQ